MPNSTILLVEDDVEIRDSLKDLLMAEGYGVEAAHHGQHALRLLRGGLRPAVILLDLMMPVMNGWEFMAAAQADQTLCSIPVIILSAVQDLSLRAKASAYFSKPLDVVALLNHLQGIA